VYIHIKLITTYFTIALLCSLIVVCCMFAEKFYSVSGCCVVMKKDGGLCVMGFVLSSLVYVLLVLRPFRRWLSDAGV